MTGSAVQIVWFKRDLRVADHAPLAAAAQAGPVLGLYVAEPDWWAQETHSARQWAFIAACLDELGADLARLGAPLRVRVGDAVETLEALRAEFGAIALWSHEETGDAWSFARDRRVGAWARASGVPWRETPPAGVQRRLKSRDGWARGFDLRMASAQIAEPALAPPPGASAAPDPSPSGADLGLQPDPCPERQPGGRRAALATLGGFLHERGRDYRREMSTPVAGFRACSRLSTHLAWGSLSTKEAVQAGEARLAELRGGDRGAARGWIGSIESFLARLHWRCHFMQKLEDEPEIERRCMHTAYEGVRGAADHDASALVAWAAGETGLPFVDACMRALTATGWMNFRMRSMLTAVASYHLWLDWRRSGPVLARKFTDFEPGIHWSQMQMQSGVTGINTVRIYNPVKQSKDQDPSGVFIRQWLPELAGLDDAALHEPWKADPAALRAAGVVLGETYPDRIIDHEAAARAAKERIYAVRRGESFHQEKQAVMKKHASRKSNRDDGPAQKARAARRRAAPASQLKLDL